MIPKVIFRRNALLNILSKMIKIAKTEILSQVR